MIVYILIGNINYEGNDYLGVFSTKELAEKEEKRRREDKSSMNYDDYNIIEDTVKE